MHSARPPSTAPPRPQAPPPGMPVPRTSSSTHTHTGTGTHAPTHTGAPERPRTSSQSNIYGTDAARAADTSAAGAASAPRPSDLAFAQTALDRYVSAESVGRFRLSKMIGKGAYGAVYVAYDHAVAPPRRVAIKHIVNAFVSSTDARRIYREMKVMAHFNHPNVLPLYEVLQPRDAAGFSHIYLVSELMETDLHRVIHSRQDLTSDHISYFVYQTLCALKTIHAAGVLHRDLKPSNLLVNADCSIKMCDFGLARESEPSMSAAFTEYVCTRWYRAPEVLLSGGKYTQAVDVWSVGCVLAELLLRRPMFPGENYLHQLQLITEYLGSPTEDDLYFVRSEAARSFMLRLPKYPGIAFAKVFPHVRGPCLDLVERMLAFDPAKRITVDEALAHPFLARVRSARRHVNEDSVVPPKPFRLRVPGGSAGLRAMTVEQIKARFFAELCGAPITPTPTSIPAGGLFDVSSLAALPQPADDGLHPGTASARPSTSSAEPPYRATLTGPATVPETVTQRPPESPMAEDDDRPPAEWQEDTDMLEDDSMYIDDDDTTAPPTASHAHVAGTGVDDAASVAGMKRASAAHALTKFSAPARAVTAGASAGTVATANITASTGSSGPMSPRDAALRTLAAAAAAPTASPLRPATTGASVGSGRRHTAPGVTPAASGANGY